ncbi:hypothetical protein [Sulfuracidifex tepidarius]|uniref:Uncharacterized protein n=1 Tax=Sulfuracidifex tepidarius TaxID=1294262 RepID=A0A510E211_9CREN|nr:hypothetical protein [Sulfuracidifex tepidarius]BBG23775.1 hypothetical protein IC006_1069 [Sulfuracidifex tepidarius]BBG26529.1 hypothetical protein IC007_1043 [Sulfuracidifex tepidarius]
MLAIAIGIALYFSIIEGKLTITGVSSISQIYGYVIGGILVLSWGFFIPSIFCNKRQVKEIFAI